VLHQPESILEMKLLKHQLSWNERLQMFTNSNVITQLKSEQVITELEWPCLDGLSIFSHKVGFGTKD
jgi:hypothetical protein